MIPFAKPALWSARFKLVRAEEHLDSVLHILRGFAYGDCHIFGEKDAERNLVIFRVSLPKPPDILACVIGDFLFNVRCALDHIIYSLVLSNAPNELRDSTAFPICSTADNFAAARKRHRLDGVPEKAVALIERLQPYHAGNEPLAMLDELHNIDKHKSLHLTTAVAREVELKWLNEQFPFLVTFLGNEELRDGAQFGDVGVALDARFASQLAEMKVHGKAAIFVAFDNSTAESLELYRVDAMLHDLLLGHETLDRREAGELSIADLQLAEFSARIEIKKTPALKHRCETFYDSLRVIRHRRVTIPRPEIANHNLVRRLVYD